MKKQTHHPRKRILLIAPFPAPFIDVDIEILQNYGTVKPLIQSGFRAVGSILWNVFSADVVLCWFASVYGSIGCLYARLLKKPCIIVVGGVDAAAIPELSYGIWLSAWKRLLVKRALRCATLNLVVSESLKHRLVTLANYEGKNVRYLPTGYDTNYWKPGQIKERIVLTVARCDTWTRMKIKGIDYLIQAAERLPEIPFLVIGVEEALLRQTGITPPPNVRFLPPMPQEELRSYYQKCAVFCQPSRSEGLPNTLCEAMACGCIPVGTDVDGIPTAIGDTGFVVPLGDVEALANALKQAVSLNVSHGYKARERIVNEFPLTRRQEGLRKAIEEIQCD